MREINFNEISLVFITQMGAGLELILRGYTSVLSCEYTRIFKEKETK